MRYFETPTVLCPVLPRLLFLLEQLISAFFETLKFAKESATPPPAKYVNMSKIDQASVNIDEFVAAVLPSQLLLAYSSSRLVQVQALL